MSTRSLVRRAFIALVAFACGPSSDITHVGTLEATLVVAPTIHVVQGETTSVDVRAGPIALNGPMPPSTTFLITTGPLPEGVTCSHVVVSSEDFIHYTLSCSATIDAPIAEIPIQFLAVTNGTIIGIANTLLDVSGVAGSLDPGNQVFVERFAPTAAPGVPWLFGTNVTSSAAATISSDGRVAIDVNGESGESVAIVDATNTVIDSPQVQKVSALAWDGSDLFVATASDVRRLGPSGNSLAPTTMTIASLETTASGSVVAAGNDTNDSTLLTTFTVDGATLDATPPIQVASANMIATNTITTSQGTLVGLAGNSGPSVVQLDPQGAVVATSTLDAQWSHANQIVALPNGEPLVLGLAELQTPNTPSPVGFIHAFDVAFGALGHTYIDGLTTYVVGVTTLVAGAIDPSGRWLYVTGTLTLHSEIMGWVARIRLGP
jgi:hypothetical protein